MKIDTYDKFKEYVESLNNKKFIGVFYLDDILDNTFYWELNSTIKLVIIYDWYFDVPSFTIGLDIKYNDRILEEHWQIVEDKLTQFLERVQNEGIVCIIKKTILGVYSIVDIMFGKEYNESIKNRYKDNIFNKYFKVFSKDK